MGLFFMVRLGPLVPVKGNLNATAYNDNDSVLPTLWQQFDFCILKVTYLENLIADK
jgi:hypothetical protein